MSGGDVVALVIMGLMVLFALHWIVTLVHWLVMKALYARKVECECRTPKWGMIGEVFICPECLWKWSVWWDDFSTGWGWMPYYKKIWLKLGLIPEEDFKDEEPLPEIVEPEPQSIVQKVISKATGRPIVFYKR